MYNVYMQGRSQDLGGGARIFFFRFGNLRLAKPCALVGGFGGMLPRENFLKCSNLVRFSVYLDQIVSLKIFKNYHFLYKNFKNYHFLYNFFLNAIFYIKIYFLDTRLL